MKPPNPFPCTLGLLKGENMKKVIEILGKLGACREAMDWAKDYESFQDCWNKCERGDWLLWLCGRLSSKPESDGRKKLVWVACQCARLALPYVKKGEDRPLKAIETAEAWATGNAAIDDVRDAADAAADAAYAAADATTDAAVYAADAAYAAYAAAGAAAYAAYAAAYATGRKKTLKQCADIVRDQYPAESVEAQLTYLRCQLLADEINDALNETGE